MKQKLIIGGIIVIEISIIAYISIVVFVKITQWKNPPLSVNPLTSKIITMSPKDRLHNFYTLPSNSVQQEHISWLPQPVSYSFNNDGLHDRYNYKPAKPADRFRIITLGDSFVFGLWVNTAQNFSEVFEDQLNSGQHCSAVTKFEVINLGVPGFDLIYAAQRYKDLGTKYTPDLIIWFMRDENMFLNADRYHDLSSQYKKELEADKSSQGTKIAMDISIEASGLAYKKIIDDFQRATADQQNELLQLETASLYELRKIFNGPILVMSDTSIPKRYQQLIETFIRSSDNVYYAPVEITETFHPYDYHPSAKGHADIAAQLLKNLTTKSLIPCKDTE